MSCFICVHLDISPVDDSIKQSDSEKSVKKYFAGKKSHKKHPKPLVITQLSLFFNQNKGIR